MEEGSAKRALVAAQGEYDEALMAKSQAARAEEVRAEEASKSRTELQAAEADATAAQETKDEADKLLYTAQQTLLAAQQAQNEFTEAERAAHANVVECKEEVSAAESARVAASELIVLRQTAQERAQVLSACLLVLTALGRMKWPSWSGGWLRPERRWLRLSVQLLRRGACMLLELTDVWAGNYG